VGLSSPVIDGVDSWADVPAAKIVDAEHGVMQCVSNGKATVQL
jgi:hypothetical protein